MSKKSGTFGVQKILDKKIINGKEKFHIKWEGYDDPKDCTWEPRSNLVGCSKMLQDFERNLEKPKAGIRTDSRPTTAKNIRNGRTEQPAIARRQTQIYKPSSDQDEEDIYEGNEDFNENGNEEEDEDFDAGPSKKQTAVRSTNREKNDVSSKQRVTKRRSDLEAMEVEQEPEAQGNNDVENLNQLGSGQKGEYTIEGIVRDKENKDKYYFKAVKGNQKRYLSRQELTQKDPYSLLHFYEKHIEFLGKK